MNTKRQQELIEKMKYITILDFEAGRVFQYKIMDNGRLDTSALSADGDIMKII